MFSNKITKIFWLTAILLSTVMGNGFLKDATPVDYTIIPPKIKDEDSSNMVYIIFPGEYFNKTGFEDLAHMMHNMS